MADVRHGHYWLPCGRAVQKRMAPSHESIHYRVRRVHRSHYIRRYYEPRRRLIDSFVNAIYLFDDYLVITFNYKEGTKRVTFAEIEEAFGSDLSSLTAPVGSADSQ